MENNRRSISNKKLFEIMKQEGDRCVYT